MYFKPRSRRSAILAPRMPDLFPDVVRIPAGEFAMGADDGDDDERPAHRVHLDEFFIGAAPVTHDEYARFIAETNHPVPAIREFPQIVTAEREAEFHALATPYVWRAGAPPPDRGAHPVTLVGYDDALAYCRWLSTRISMPVRLPSEAEWERAARGGFEGRRYPWGDDLDVTRANYLAPGRDKGQHGTTPVGQHGQNPYGLADVAGNVWEWIEDWYDGEYYLRSPRRNPRGPSAGILRVVRGGAWVASDTRMLRCAYRHKVPPDSYAYSIGFRIAYSAAL